MYRIVKVGESIEKVWKGQNIKNKAVPHRYGYPNKLNP